MKKAELISVFFCVLFFNFGLSIGVMLNVEVFKEKLRAATLHLVLTGIVASFSAGVVFLVWYPEPYTNIAGGIDLWTILICVELTLGPLMSLIIYDVRKSVRSLIVDYSFVGLVQACALFYGLSTLYVARPVFLVFVKDRFEFVMSIDLEGQDWEEAKYWRSGSVGPTLLGVRWAKNDMEKNELLFETVSSGRDIHLRPKYYKKYSGAEIEAAAQPVDDLLNKLRGSEYAFLQEDLSQYVGGEYVWLPAVNGYKYWVAIVRLGSSEVEKFYAVDSWELD